MVKEPVNIMKYHKRMTAAAVIVLSLLAAGCGSGAKDEHAKHASQNGAESAANGHNGHGAEEGEAAPAGTEAAAGHSGHGGVHDAEASAVDHVKLEWAYSPEQPKVGEETQIELSLRDSAGKSIEEFELNHEKLMHLIVVSEDLAEFSHIHPEYKGAGKFEIKTTFAKSGEYKLFADFIPSGHPQMTMTSNVTVAGKEQAAVPIQKDGQLTRTVDGVVASLEISTYQPGETADLTFTLSDEKTKEPIANLEPYLGAIGHVVIISEDLKHYLHVHPKNDNESGPTAVFSTEFPAPGLYKIWGQFQRSGETFIIPFTVEAK
jgi:outer membrane murein-binding lipoprotein Lpp